MTGLGQPLPTPLTRSTAEILTPLLRLIGSAPPSPNPSLLAPPTLTEAERLPADRLLQLTAALIDAKFVRGATGLSTPRHL